MNELDHYSEAVNAHENEFSMVFGDASRSIKALLNVFSMTASFLLLVLVSFIALRLIKNSERTEQTLLDEQTRLSTILRTSSDGNHIVNTEGVLVDAIDEVTAN